MKKILLSMILVVALVSVSQAANTNYWPNNTNTAPVNLGATYGINAYVVGASKAAVSGSMAIGDATGVAYVKDATNAVQIGAGANTTAGTVKFRGTQIYPAVGSTMTGNIPIGSLTNALGGVVSTNFTFLSATDTTGRVTVANGVITAVTLSGE